MYHSNVTLTPENWEGLWDDKQEFSVLLNFSINLKLLTNIAY